jgi:hypothetical protein
MLVGNLALTSAALFTGAAFYINFAEHPARMGLEDRPLLAQWKPSYDRGFTMQSALAVVGCLLGFSAWWMTGRLAFVAGASLMIANWPWTLIGIMPTNRILKATDLAVAGGETRALLERWSVLHGVRTVLGASATLSFLYAIS